MSRPVGGILSSASRRLGGHPSVRPTRGLPLRAGGSPMSPVGLAPGGGCRAARVAPDAGALLPHRFTLTCDRRRTAGPSAVCSLLPCPAGRPALALASTVPCGVPTFLDPVEPRPRPPGRLTVATRLSCRGRGGRPPWPGVSPRRRTSWARGVSDVRSTLAEDDLDRGERGEGAGTCRHRQRRLRGRAGGRGRVGRRPRAGEERRRAGKTPPAAARSSLPMRVKPSIRADAARRSSGRPAPTTPIISWRASPSTTVGDSPATKR